MTTIFRTRYRVIRGRGCSICARIELPTSSVRRWPWIRFLRAQFVDAVAEYEWSRWHIEKLISDQSLAFVAAAAVTAATVATSPLTFPSVACLDSLTARGRPGVSYSSQPIMITPSSNQWIVNKSGKAEPLLPRPPPNQVFLSRTCNRAIRWQQQLDCRLKICLDILALITNGWHGPGDAEAAGEYQRHVAAALPLVTDLQSPFSLWFGGVRDNLVTIRLQQMTLDAAKIELFRVFLMPIVSSFMRHQRLLLFFVVTFRSR